MSFIQLARIPRPPMAQSLANINAPSILLVKTSSLGDVIHNLPVVSDIIHHYPGAHIDWVVEDCFVPLAKLHPGVRNVFPVAVRRWRNKLFNLSTWHEIFAFRTALSVQQYDFVIDTQGLIKSALLMRSARGFHCGFDNHSAREPFASIFYQRGFFVATGQHAVERNRQLVAQILDFELETSADFGVQLPKIEALDWLTQNNYAVLLHATSRTDKLWSETNWIKLGNTLREANICCILPWGSNVEQERSLRIAAVIPDAFVPPHLDLNQAAVLLGKANAVIGVDTGLAHLAAAMNVPTVGIYTATSPTLTGLYANDRIINLGNIDRAPDVESIMIALRKIGVC